MLNTDLHSTGVSGTTPSNRRQRKKMTKAEFLNNLRGVESVEDLSRDYLSAIFDSIALHPIEIHVLPSRVENSNTDRARGDAKSEFIANLNSSFASLLGSVKPAQELLRGVAVHRHPFITVSDYDEANGTFGSIVPKDLVLSAISTTWHHFHGIINATLDIAHLDNRGLECCLDVLKYGLCSTIILEMSMERAAFITQLARIKFFKESGGMDEEENAEQAFHDDQISYRQEEWYRKLNGYLSSPSEEAKGLAVQLVYYTVKETKNSLQVDSKLKRDMKRITQRIRKGELLLNDPSRIFVFEGDLVKRSNKSGKNVTYHFFLFSDVLIYTHQLSGGDYKIHEELPLHLIKITADFTGTGRKTNRAFRIHHPQKSFTVFAEDEDSKSEWMKKITSAVRREVERKARVEGARLASAAFER